ncbi:hypothetical protein CEXT_602511 [Caerostris extrusa]|uniref:Uncharacterized protein n=1 Tax=Caerostris extrusa TaxID=172846 RepID=A0AAV4XR23_CAEEX|nr:hypothetical protein CEXT_602511 [Caerostris extrusa]
MDKTQFAKRETPKLCCHGQFSNPKFPTVVSKRCAGFSFGIVFPLWYATVTLAITHGEWMMGCALELIGDSSESPPISSLVNLEGSACLRAFGMGSVQPLLIICVL